MNKVRVCKRCRCKVKVSAVRGYRYYCPRMDEDLYRFETEKIRRPQLQSMEQVLNQVERNDEDVEGPFAAILYVSIIGGWMYIVADVSNGSYYDSFYLEVLSRWNVERYHDQQLFKLPQKYQNRIDYWNDELSGLLDAYTIYKQSTVK